MRWSVYENPPPRQGMKVFLNGEEVPKVTAFDTGLGWVESHCLDGHTGHPGESHLDPHCPDVVCRIVQCGRVTVQIPTVGGSLQRTYPTKLRTAVPYDPETGDTVDPDAWR